MIFKHKKILVIEDEKSLGDILSKVLVDEGYTVQLSENGLEGLKKVDSFKPDLILLDILMPKIDGIEFLRILRLEKNKKEIPVILLTNLDGKESIKDAAKYGVSVYFVKANTSLETLKKWIHEML